MPTVTEETRAVPASGEVPAQPRFKRVLGLNDLLFYGIVLVQPIGAVGMFGVASQLSRGHMVLTLMVAMAAMMLTAVSYGRMASVYPTAGSAYTYVGRGLNPHLGFLAGWAMILDYLVIPVVNVVYGALSAERLLPAIPFAAWVLILAGGMTILNIRGIRWTARANQVLLALMCGVIAWFIVAAVASLIRQHGWQGLFSWEPIFQRANFDWRAVGAATSFAALTYIGFDGISTLAEDAKNPKRDVMLATVLTCLVIGLCGAAQVYLAQRLAPDWANYTHVETAFMDIAGGVGGSALFSAVAGIFAVACLGSGLTGQVGAARLLVGMGRDNVLPRGLFARLDPRRNTPVWNICLVGVIAAVGAFTLNYERAAELLNFGAFLAFMGVNAAAFRQFWLYPPAGHKRHWFLDLASPVLGFVFCFAIWISLPTLAKVIGGGWFLAGLIYDGIRTRGFRERPAQLDLGDTSG
jgi:amino acid transporter